MQGSSGSNKTSEKKNGTPTNSLKTGTQKLTSKLNAGSGSSKSNLFLNRNDVRGSQPNLDVNMPDCLHLGLPGAGDLVHSKSSGNNALTEMIVRQISSNKNKGPKEIFINDEDDDDVLRNLDIGRNAAKSDRSSLDVQNYRNK